MYYMLKMNKRCTLKVPHEPFYPRNTCGATFSTRFPQCFNFQCGNSTNPSINVICVKKIQILLSYQIQDARARIGLSNFDIGLECYFPNNVLHEEFLA